MKILNVSVIIVFSASVCRRTDGNNLESIQPRFLHNWQKTDMFVFVKHDEKLAGLT